MDYSPPDPSVHGMLQARIPSGLPFPCPKNLLNPGIEPRFLALQLDSLLAEPPGKSLFSNKKLLEPILGTNSSPTEQGGGEVLLGLDPRS